jgi:hypothetical protein
LFAAIAWFSRKYADKLGFLEEDPETGMADFRMARTVILLFDPRLRCQIERIDGEVGFAFEQSIRRPSTRPQKDSCFAFW